MDRVEKSDQIEKEEEGVFLFFSFRSAIRICRTFVVVVVLDGVCQSLAGLFKIKFNISAIVDRYIYSD